MDTLPGYAIGETLLARGELLVMRARRAVDGQSVLLVTPLLERSAPSTSERLERTYALRDLIDPAWGTHPLALLEHLGRRVLVTTDSGAGPLERILLDAGGRLPLPVCLDYAVSISMSVSRVHEAGLTHRDIKPAFLLMGSGPGSPAWIGGYGVAFRTPRHQRQGSDPKDVAVGTLAYMAPEQTGRMNRSTDSRSDLYAFGVTLYRMLTGELPFTATDPSELIHSHLARIPEVPSARASHIPMMLDAIVMKLLAKAPEDRYQTAAGVHFDLQQCQRAWAERGAIEPFSLGAQDRVDHLVVPEKLYGRAREIHTLLAAFERVVRSRGVELVLVSGYSGVGKSSLVSELQKALVPPRGLFASGKFDQYKRGIPYATLAEAFQRLVRQILAKSDDEVAVWRETLEDALGVNGQLVVSLIPEIEHILGPQPPVPDLPPPDTRNRFQRVLRRFIGVFATAAHPLALFLDDLQWLDTATLELLEHLLSSSDVENLLVIGAYRDNEVDAAHPLVRTMNAIRRAGASLHEIVLAPLGVSDITALVADALHCDRADARPLAELLHEKTDGNPFFTTQFFATLEEAGLLVFDHATGAWRWDIARIRAQGYTDNVLVLMNGKLGRLPADTQDVLKHFACLGNAAALSTIADVCELTRAALDAALAPALAAGLVFQTGEVCTFLHDRVQEAAYALVPAEERPAVHLRIGRMLAARITDAEIDEGPFEIVNQLDRGLHLIESAVEREMVARFNLAAGKRAKSSTAYASALSYLGAGLTLLAGVPWEQAEQLHFELEFHSADCEFLTGEPLLAEPRLARLAARVTTVTDRALVTCLQVVLYTALDRSDRAVEACFDYLRGVGIEWPVHPDADVVRAEYDAIWTRIGTRSIDALVDLPLVGAPEIQATIDVLTAVQPAALYLDQGLNCLIVCRMVNLSLAHGNCDASCYAYVIFAMLLGPVFGEHDAAYRFGKLAFDLVETRGLEKFKARVLMCFGNIVSPWRQHAREGRPLVRRAFGAAQESGDLTFAVYSCHNLITNLLVCGDPLEEVQHAAEGGFDFARKARISLAVDFITGQLRLIMSLRGLLPKFGFFDDASFSETSFEAHLEVNPSLSMATCWYWIRKLQARFHAGEVADALAASSAAARLLWTSPSFLEICDYHFYTALALTAAPGGTVSEALRAHLRELEVEERCCPANFENRAALVAAEIARLEDRPSDAMRLYAKAIRSSRAHGFVENEALANELAAAFYAQNDIEASADAHLRHAADAYQRWGAHGKVAQLLERHPSLREERSALPRAIDTSIGELDIATVVKMSLAVSSEIVLDRLIEKLMALVLEHAGATRALLLRTDEQSFTVEAEAVLTAGKIDVRPRPDEARYATSVVQYTARSRGHVVIDDATSPGMFSGDAYLNARGSRSVLAVGLVHHGVVAGLLYLENTLATHVFTASRVAVLEVLATQAAISLENARLYAALDRARSTMTEAERLGATGSFNWTVVSGEIAWSDEVFRIFGAVSKATPDMEAILRRIHDDDRERVRAIVRDAVTARADFAIAFRLVNPDDRVIHVDVLAHSVVDAEGELIEYVGAVKDVTARHGAEQALERTQAALTHVTRVATLGELTASITHEINQPLAAIQMSAAACARWLGGIVPNTEEARKSLALITRDSRRASSVIARLRALFKKTGANPLPVDMNEAIEEVIALMRPALGRNGAVLETHFDPMLPNALGDRVQLQQVIMNLLLNGAEAMGEVHDRKRSLVVRTDVDGEGRVRVRVSDHGSGIPTEKLEQVFEAFHTTKDDGMGIGLSISRTIIESHQGRIWARSNDGPGATFTFEVPASVGVASGSRLSLVESR